MLSLKACGQCIKGVQDDLRQFGLSIKIYYCYRPQRTVNYFVQWPKDMEDTKTKKEFYPTLNKGVPFKDGCIMERSSHSRGSTVDLTIIPLNSVKEPEFILGETPQVECYKDDR